MLDLTEIGKADHKFLYEEAQYIGELIAAWKVNLTDLVAESATMWSILGPGAGDDGWTPVHDLMLIYVTLAHGTDLTLSREEVEAIREKLGEWLPNADQGTVRRVLHDVMRVYQDEHERTFDEAVEAVKATVPAYQREAILDDLRYIAYADGVLLVEERVMIEKLAEAWDCDTTVWEYDPLEAAAEKLEGEEES